MSFVANLTVNMDTLPDSLIFSDKEVKYLANENLKDDETIPYAVCKEKFKSGKHHWEMIVGDSWCVGVCEKKQREKLELTLTKNKGFWLLQCDKNRLYANTKEKTEVTTSELPTKLGVFLDCENRTLSFYDVDRNSVLCIFTRMPKKKTFIPLISPGTQGHVTLC